MEEEPKVKNVANRRVLRMDAAYMLCSPGGNNIAILVKPFFLEVLMLGWGHIFLFFVIIWVPK